MMMLIVQVDLYVSFLQQWIVGLFVKQRKPFHAPGHLSDYLPLRNTLIFNRTILGECIL